MACRHLAAAPRGPDDYHHVYGQLLAQADEPVILHWLGADVRPGAGRLLGLARTWRRPPRPSLRADRTSTPTRSTASRSRLLDADARDRAARRAAGGRAALHRRRLQLPRADRRATATRHSDALLGIFDAIAPAPRRRSRPWTPATRDGVPARSSTRPWPLSRHLFETPTYYYKTGIVFLAWLTGHQEHFTMVGGAAGGALPAAPGRGCVRLADAAGLLDDPDLAAARMERAARRCTESAGAPTGGARTMHRAVAEPGDDQAADAGRGRRGCAARPASRHRPVAGAGAEVGPRARPRSWSPTPACGCHQPVPGRLPHRRRRPTAGRRSTTTGAPSTRRRRWRGGTPAPLPCSCWSPAGCPPGSTATCPAPGERVADALAELAPYAAASAASGWRIEPLHPMFSADRAWSPRSARPSTWPSRSRPTQVGVVVDTYHVWWDPQLARQIARAGAAGSRPTRSATGSCRCPPDVLLGRGHDRRRRASTSPPITGAVDGGRLHRRHRGRDLQPADLGRRPATRSPPRTARSPSTAHVGA